MNGRQFELKDNAGTFYFLLINKLEVSHRILSK
jgi:hypothetical protein